MYKEKVIKSDYLPNCDVSIVDYDGSKKKTYYNVSIQLNVMPNFPSKSKTFTDENKALEFYKSIKKSTVYDIYNSIKL
jgi:hypothetical protein